MRHFSDDSRFAYYFASPGAKYPFGFRFSDSEVAVLRGEFGKPDTYQAALTEKLPVPTNGATGHFFDAVAEVIKEHPEVAKLLSGEVSVGDLR